MAASNLPPLLYISNVFFDKTDDNSTHECHHLTKYPTDDLLSHIANNDPDIIDHCLTPLREKLHVKSPLYRDHLRIMLHRRRLKGFYSAVWGSHLSI